MGMKAPVRMQQSTSLVSKCRDLRPSKEGSTKGKPEVATPPEGFSRLLLKCGSIKELKKPLRWMESCHGRPSVKGNVKTMSSATTYRLRGEIHDTEKLCSLRI